MAIRLVQNAKGDSNDVGVVAQATTISAPAKGSLIVTAIAIDKNSGVITLPPGFIPILTQYVQTSVSSWMAYRISDGTETSISWSWVSTQKASTWVGVFTGSFSNPLARSEQNTSVEVAVTSQIAGTIVAGWGKRGLAIAAFMADSGFTVDGSRAYSTGFSEIAYSISASDPGESNPGLMIATKDLLAEGVVTTTFSCTDTGDQMTGFLAVFTEAEDAGPNLWPLLVAA